jgi:hypothetical protein
MVAVAACVGAIVVATPAFGVGSRLFDLFRGTPVSSERLTASELHVLSAMTNGTNPHSPASNREDLTRFAASSFRQIAVRDGRTYFAANLRGGGLCVSIGSGQHGRLLGSITCSPDFPSAARPILDESVFGGSLEQPQMARLEGFAADAVASVGVVSSTGELEAVTPVEDNVYLRTSDLPTTPIREIVAVDANGMRLYSECFVRRGC